MRVLLFFFLTGMLGPIVCAADWKPCLWTGERCFSSPSVGWLAIVSLDRGRLSYFGPATPRHNLLYFPTGPRLDLLPTWGGERFWLGPQSGWKQAWPPPADWEKAPAARWSVEGGKLKLDDAHTDRTLPQLHRTYFWRDGALHVEGRWTGGRYQAIHILQLPAGATASVHAAPSAEIPRGFVLLPDGTHPAMRLQFDAWPAVLAPPAGDRLLLHNRRIESKFGFPNQPILVREGGDGFTLERGDVQGRRDGVTDLGLLTQAYTGDGTNPYLEAEQLSPLLAEGPGENSFTVILRPWHKTLETR